MEDVHGSKPGCNEECPAAHKLANDERSGKVVRLCGGGILDAKSAKRYANRNIYGLGVSLMLNYSALLGLFALQSTLNATLGLGTIVAIYVSSMVVGFIIVGITAVLGTKYCFVISLCLTLSHVVCNYYPVWYTLFPSAVLCGAGVGIMWASLTGHISGVAGLVAPVLNKERSYLISKYTGIFFFLFYVSYIPGNLASSLIFYPYNRNTSDFVPHMEEGYSGSANMGMYSMLNDSKMFCELQNVNTFNDIQFYSLLSVYVVLMAISVLVAMLFMDNLPSENSFFSSDRKFQLYLKKPFVDLLKILKYKKTILVSPTVFIAGVLPAFSFGTFTKLFISDCFGIHLVGFAVILMGVCSSAVGMLYSKLIKLFPRFVVALLAATLVNGFIVFLLVWKRAPSYAVVFSFPVIWGTGDSLWNTVAASLPGILFCDNPEGASSIYTTVVTGGFALGYLIATVLSLNSQLGVIFTVVILATLGDLIIEFRYIYRLACCNPGRKELKGSQTSHSDEYNSSSKSPGSGVNALYSIFQNRRPSSLSVIVEEEKASESCKPTANVSASTQPSLTNNVTSETPLVFVIDIIVPRETSV